MCLKFYVAIQLWPHVLMPPAARCVHASSHHGSARVRQAVVSRFHTTVHGEALMHDAGGVAFVAGAKATLTRACMVP